MPRQCIRKRSPVQRNPTSSGVAQFDTMPTVKAPESPSLGPQLVPMRHYREATEVDLPAVCTLGEEVNAIHHRGSSV